MALAILVLVPIVAVAQDSVKPAAKAVADGNPSKWDIFAGYSYLAPNSSAIENMKSGTQSVSFDNANFGLITNVTRFFTPHLGVQVEMAEHALTTDTPSNNDGFLTMTGGVVYRYPTGNLTPFVHALFGTAQVGGPASMVRTFGWDITGGGGLDYQTPLLNHHLAIRLFQADYEPMHINYGSGLWEGKASINGAVRLSAGLVYHVGEFLPPPPVTLAVAVSPASVFPGDAVSATATAGALDPSPKNHVIYSWSGSGVTGNGTSATVTTANLAPGTYTVKAGVKEGKAGKEGLKPGQSAEAEASFTVKQFEPPTIACAVSPTTIKPGDTSAVTATGLSPQSRPLTYSFAASAGSISGTGATATYSSTGAPTGGVTITCNVTDDKGQVASSTATLTILAPYVPPVLHTQELSPLGFEIGKLGKKNNARVNNEVKAILDGLALTLNKQPSTRLVVVGEASVSERADAEKAAKKSHKKGAKAEDLAAQRAVNVKDYLVKEKGIDASRITVMTGTTDKEQVDLYLVPEGANFSSDVHGVSPVDETAVKPQVRKPLPVRKHAAKKKSTK
jgi:hypothetical protein